MKKNFILGILSALVCGCVSDVERANRQAAMKILLPIEMGVILPKSEDSELMQEVKNAIVLSAEEFNASQKKNSSKINLFTLEINGTKEEFLTALEILKIRNTDIIQAGFTNECAFELKEFEKTNALVNFFSQYPPIATQTENATRIFLNGAQVCEEMAKKIPHAKLAEKKSGIILTENSILGKSCSEYLKFQTSSHNIKFAFESFSPNEKNFHLFGQNIMQSKTDYAIIFAPQKKLELILAKLSEANYKGEIFVNCTLLNDAKLAFKNLKITRVKTAFELNKTNASDFKTSYKKRYHKEPSLAAALAYDAVKITASTLLNAAKDSKTAKLLLKNKSIDGVSGTINFDSFGDTTLQVELTNE